jgi:hypothetical protein
MSDLKDFSEANPFRGELMAHWVGVHGLFVTSLVSRQDLW